ncbi:nicotinate-nucleotide--dimethylbenzimidazole phosphoribosyltransferase, partial [Psychromonas aquatilis]
KFFEIISTVSNVPNLFITALQEKIDLKTKPQGSLGLLESVAFKTPLLQGTLSPVYTQPSIIIIAADLGIAD